MYICLVCYVLLKFLLRMRNTSKIYSFRSDPPPLTTLFFNLRNSNFFPHSNTVQNYTFIYVHICLITMQLCMSVEYFTQILDNLSIKRRKEVVYGLIKAKPESTILFIEYFASMCTSTQKIVQGFLLWHHSYRNIPTSFQCTESVNCF